MSKEHILVVYINRIFHDLTASDYDKQHPEIFLLERERIGRLFERFFGNEKFPKVIDIGSGTGFIYETWIYPSLCLWYLRIDIQSAFI